MQRLAWLLFLMVVVDISAGDAGSDAAAAQLRGSGRARSESTGDCSAGLLSRLRNRSEDWAACLDTCAGSCGALAQAFGAYLSQGGASAAKKEVCNQSTAFRCYVTGSAASKCSSLISDAAKFGFPMPRSESDLEKECGHDARNPQADASHAATPSGDRSVSQALSGDSSIESALQTRASAVAERGRMENALAGKTEDSRCANAPEGQTCVANPNGGRSNAWIYCSNQKRLSAGETSCEKKVGHLSWCQSDGVGLTRGYCDDPFCRNGGAASGSGKYCHKGNVVLCQGVSAPRIVQFCSDQTFTSTVGSQTCQVTQQYRCAGGFPNPYCYYAGETRSCQFQSSLLAMQAPTIAAAGSIGDNATEESLHAVKTGMATANATETANAGGCHADLVTLTACGKSCFRSQPRSSCISSCLHGKGISLGCASLLGDKSDCSITSCLDTCVASDAGAACTECVKSHCNGSR